MSRFMRLSSRIAGGFVAALLPGTLLFAPAAQAASGPVINGIVCGETRSLIQRQVTSPPALKPTVGAPHAPRRVRVRDATRDFCDSFD